MFPAHMRPAEAKVIEPILREALSRGYLISVYDGEEWPVKMSSDYEAITAEIAATDCTWLRFRQFDKSIVGTVFLVHGNDDEVVCDYTDNPTMAELVG